MRHIILSSVAYLVLLFCHIFPHYLTNGTILGKKVIEHNMCFDFLYKVCVKRFS
jgi:hypothetical protein